MSRQARKPGFSGVLAPFTTATTVDFQISGEMPGERDWKIMNIAAGRSEPDTIEEIKESWHREIPDHKQVFVGELAEHGEWIVANIQTGSFWPIKAQKVMYRG